MATAIEKLEEAIKKLSPHWQDIQVVIDGREGKISKVLWNGLIFKSDPIPQDENKS